MSNQEARAKSFRNWEELAGSPLGKQVSAVVEDVAVRGDVASADPQERPQPTKDESPMVRRPKSP